MVCYNAQGDPGVCSDSTESNFVALNRAKPKAVHTLCGQTVCGQDNSVVKRKAEVSKAVVLDMVYSY